METLDIKKELAGNAYPGRGIVIGKSADGVHAVIAYFIMGRSVNSRNRVFVEQGDGIRTRLCMLLLGKVHIGEVQASLWDEETRRVCAEKGVILL